MYQMRLIVPDQSLDMSVDAVQLDPVPGGLTDYTSFMVADNTTVYMMWSVTPASCAMVVDNGMPLFPQVPISLQITPASIAQPDPAQYWFATKIGAGDVRVIG